MRSTWLALVFLVGCGEDESVREINRLALVNCEGFDQCYTPPGNFQTARCDEACIGEEKNRSCCECAIDFDCGPPSVDRCMKNFEGGGDVTLRTDCFENNKCGAFCSPK